MKHYILDHEGNPVGEPDLMRWGVWFEKADRQLKNTIYSRSKVEAVRISTIFLGIDHNFGETGEPILWETMVFGGKLNDEMRRYSSKERALAGHEKMVKAVQEAES